MIDFDKIEKGDLIKLESWADIAIVLKKTNDNVFVYPLKLCENSYCFNIFSVDIFDKWELCMDDDQIICQ